MALPRDNFITTSSEAIFALPNDTFDLMTQTTELADEETTSRTEQNSGSRAPT
jgi:hypothetical protein